MMSGNTNQKSMTLVAEYHSNSDIRIKEIARPNINDHEALVKMEACGICGTDVMEWYRQKTAPKVLGHEMSGSIVQLGKNVKNFSLGDRVFVSHHVPCFDCYYCKNSKHSACDSLHTGNFYPGGFSEYIKIPEENLNYGTFKLPEKMTYNEAAMIEPMACAVAGQNMLHLKDNQTILIIGSGISGLCHIILAKMKGLNVISTDISDYRVDQAKYFGSDYSFHADNISADKIREINHGRLADVVINCAGNKSAVENAFKYVDKKGEILFFAIPSSTIKLPFANLWRNETSLFFSYGAATNDISTTIDLYSEGRINFEKMITHQIKLSKIVDGFKLVEAAHDSIKVVINPDDN
tara:strand:+ start:258 stop:1310 length:1053 start_codon:yes stop_codon:yes gene_type:complete